MLRVFQATGEDEGQVQAIFWEYLQWVNVAVDEAFGISFDITAILEHDMAKLEVFSPPQGRLLLADYGGEIAGVACMRKLTEDTGEVKRMYVRPAFRGKRIGRALVDALITEAQRKGYRRLRLDSARFMQAAHHLYRSVGFEEIAAYEGSEIPEAFQAHWVFMEKSLAQKQEDAGGEGPVTA